MKVVKVFVSIISTLKKKQKTQGMEINSSSNSPNKDLVKRIPLVRRIIVYQRSPKVPCHAVTELTSQKVIASSTLPQVLSCLFVFKAGKICSSCGTKMLCKKIKLFV